LVLISYFLLTCAQTWQSKVSPHAHMLDAVLKSTFNFERIISLERFKARLDRALSNLV